MPEAYFATRTYRAQSDDVADERLVNAYVEHAPEGAKSQTPVMGSPGITEFDDVGGGPIWGIHNARLGLGNLLYVVSGTTLYSVSSTAVATSLGTIMGGRRVHMSDNGAQLVIVNGLHHYVYDRTNGLLKTKFGMGMDGDFEITTTGAAETSTSVTMTLTGGPASAANVNEIIVSIQGDSQSPTFFSDRPADTETISQVATALAATIDADGDFNASASAGVITITPQAVTNLEAATVVATSYHHLITIGDSFATDDYITLTTETVGNSDETFSLLITSSHTAASIAAALNTLIDASSLLTSTVSDNIITIFGQTAGTHLLTDIYSTQDWAVISGTAPYSKQVWALDGYMLFPVTNTPSFMISALNDASRIDVLDIASIGAAETNLIGMCVNKREIFLLGENFTEVYRNSGSAGFPFTRLPGPQLEHGCAAVHTIAKGEETWAWLGNDRRVYAAKGYSAQRISTFGIEHKIEGYTKVDDAFAFTATWKGHFLYVLTFPSENQTWIYDSTTKEWHERVTSFGGDAIYTVPDLENFDDLFCGAAIGLVYADRPNDPGVVVSVNTPDGDSGGQGDGFPAVLLSQNGKLWRRQADDRGEDGSWNRVAYSRSQDKLITVHEQNDADAKYSMSSVNGGISWADDVQITKPSRWVLWIEPWGLWLAGAGNVGDENVGRSPTGTTGTWTLTSLAGTSLENVGNSGLGAAYSPSLDLAIIGDGSNGLIWTTDGSTFADADTFPATTGRWRWPIWVEDDTLFVVAGSTAGANKDIATSANGKDFVNKDTPSTITDFQSVAYSPTLARYVAFGQSGGTVGKVAVSNNSAATWADIGADDVIDATLYLEGVIWVAELGLYVGGGKDLNTDGVMIYSETGLAGSWVRATAAYS
jgi:hypothetical protein